MEINEKKEQAQSLVRIAEKKFGTYEEAKIYAIASLSGVQTVDKTKIFARNDGTFDLVFYARSKTEKPAEKKTEEITEQKVHGLTAKQRRAREKKDT
jgi:hypothetical protein